MKIVCSYSERFCRVWVFARAKAIFLAGNAAVGIKPATLAHDLALLFDPLPIRGLNVLPPSGFIDRFLPREGFDGF